MLMRFFRSLSHSRLGHMCCSKPFHRLLSAKPPSSGFWSKQFARCFLQAVYSSSQINNPIFIKVCCLLETSCVYLQYRALDTQSNPSPRATYPPTKFRHQALRRIGNKATTALATRKLLGARPIRPTNTVSPDILTLRIREIKAHRKLMNRLDT